GEAFEHVKSEHPAAPVRLLTNATIIQIINLLVTDLIENVQRTLQDQAIQTLEDVRKAPKLLVSFSPEVAKKNRELKAYLYKEMYNHYRVHRMKNKAKRILEALFRAYQEDPALLPSRHEEKMKTGGKERIICDYIAGMTDRFAIEEYEKLFDPRRRV
ncbi:MAG TPA: deoxyguanosinetriphosphate triphosphohydrolase, partial [Acidobacteriota bacterium]